MENKYKYRQQETYKCGAFHTSYKITDNENEFPDIADFVFESHAKEYVEFKNRKKIDSKVFKIYENRKCFQCNTENIDIVEFNLAQYEYAICETCIKQNWRERKIIKSLRSEE